MDSDNRNWMKRIVAVLMSALIFFTYMPGPAYAVEDLPDETPDAEEIVDVDEEDVEQKSHIHAPEAVAARAATCTEPGNIAYWYCSGCGNYYTDAEGENETTLEAVTIDPLGHDWDEGKITQRATATKDGVMTYTCWRIAQQHKKAEAIAALGEDYIPVNQAAEDAIAAVDETGTDADAEAAAAEAQTAANEAVYTAEQALEDAKTIGDEAKINAAKQKLADAKATQAKANAVAAKTKAKTSAASAAAKQSAAEAQASAGTDAAIAVAQDSIIAANVAMKDAFKAVEAAELAVQAAEKTSDDDTITAACNALSAAKTAHSSAANSVVAAQTTFAKAVAARNAAISATQAVESIDLPTVKISKPKAAKKKITVKWKKVSKKNLKKISGIEIQVATDPNFTNIVKTATAGKKKTSKTLKGLRSKTKYYVRIRAYAAGNHVSGWTKKSAKVK